MDRKATARKVVTAPIRWIGLLVRALLGAPGRAVRGTARRVADPARQVVDYWTSERATVRQGFVAVSIAAVTSLVAGLTLAKMADRIEAVEGLFVLIPVAIAMRGNIFGALAARLGTSIHSGLFEVSREKSGLLYQNVYAAILLTVGTSTAMGLIARGVAGLFDIDTVPVWDLIAIAFVSGLLSSVVVLAVTIYLSITSFRRGWDLDSVGAPLITAIGDVVTLPSVFAASFLAQIDIVTPILGLVMFGAGIAAIVHGWSMVLKVARRIVRESFPILCIAIVLDVLAGSIAEPRLEEVFLPLPAFLLIIPGFLETTGALGSILAARLGSKLHLGAVTPSAKPEAAALLDGTIVMSLGIAVYSIIAIATLLIADVAGFAYPGAWRFIAIVMTGGLMATTVASLIGYYAAIVTFRFGLDPDNHTIPLVTSGMDLLGIICLVVALVIYGVA